MLRSSPVRPATSLSARSSPPCWSRSRTATAGPAAARARLVTPSGLGARGGAAGKAALALLPLAVVALGLPDQLVEDGGEGDPEIARLVAGGQAPPGRAHAHLGEVPVLVDAEDHVDVGDATQDARQLLQLALGQGLDRGRDLRLTAGILDLHAATSCGPRGARLVSGPTCEGWRVGSAAPPCTWPPCGGPGAAHRRPAAPRC